MAQRISRGEANRVVVGHMPAAILSVLPAIFQMYWQRGEGEIVSRDLSTMTRATLLRALRECRLDVAFVVGVDEASGIVHEWVSQAPLRVVLPANHPLAGLEAIPLHSRYGLPPSRQHILSRC